MGCGQSKQQSRTQIALLQETIYKENVRYIIRIRQMCDTSCRIAFTYMLNWMTPHWDRNTTPFEDYVKSKNSVPIGAFRRALNPSQKNVMLKDPEGKTWDVTLLFQLIVWGNEFLTDKRDPIWKTETEPPTLEFLIKFIKDERNEVMHCFSPLTKEAFIKRTEQMRKSLIQMINLAGSVCTHVSKKDIEETKRLINESINHCRDDDLNPKAFKDYVNQLLLPELINFVEVDGRKELSEHLGKYKTNVPVSHLVKMKIPIDEVFVKMILETSGGNEKQMYIEDLFINKSKGISNDIILLVGDAGVGKTTLTKKILNDWIKGIQDIKGLSEFKIALHAECREYIDSFKGLLIYSMPETAQIFAGDDFNHIVGSLRTLVIMDGLDEINDYSTKLFEMIIKLKETYDKLTVLVTTRPEAVEKYEMLISRSSCKTKRIHLLGIPSEKRDEFAQKYYEGIDKSSINQHGIRGLLEYLQRTEHRLGYLWRSPFNITALVILWIMKPQVVNNITTSPELNWEILTLYIDKLKERLLNNPMTKGLPLTELKRKIELFLYTLCEEAIASLAKDDITLNTQAYNRLMKKCQELELPVEEMLSMFFKQTTSSLGTRYSFPHKAVLDFFAARYVFLQLTDTFVSHDMQQITMDVQNVLSQHLVSTTGSHNIMKDFDDALKRYLSQSTSSTSQQRRTQIMVILERSGQLDTVALPKYQNVLKCLIGMFYLDKNTSVPESAKKEALNLLKQTGVKDRKQWLSVLEDVKCDKEVAILLSREPGILDENTNIDDDSLATYITLLQTLGMPAPYAANINIQISILKEHPSINILLNIIIKNNLHVKKLRYDHDFRNPADNGASTSPSGGSHISPLLLKEITKRCSVQDYRGAYVEGMRLPSGDTWPSFSVATSADYRSLTEELHKNKRHLNGIMLCVSSEIAASDLKEPIPFEGDIDLFLPDASDIEETSKMAKALMPPTGEFVMLLFPRCGMKSSSGEMERLLQNLLHLRVKVSLAVVFPSPEKPGRGSAEEEKLENLARQLGASILWMDEEGIWRGY